MYTDKMCQKPVIQVAVINNREVRMCLQCGCGMPYNDMGEPDKNIVVDDIKKSVESQSAKGITTDEAIKNITKTWEKVKEEDKKYKAP